MDDNKIVAALVTNLLVDNLNTSNLSDSSDSDYEILRELNRRIRVPRIQYKNYVENIVSSYSDMEFKSKTEIER